MLFLSCLERKYESNWEGSELEEDHSALGRTPVVLD